MQSRDERTAQFSGRRISSLWGAAGSREQDWESDGGRLTSGSTPGSTVRAKVTRLALFIFTTDVPVDRVHEPSPGDAVS